MASNELVVRLVGDTKDLERSLSRAGRSSQSTFKKMGRAAGIAGAAIFAGLAVVAKKGFDEISESQKVLAQTQAVLKSTGGAANVTAAQVENLAGSLSDMSGVDDELIASGENLLLTFKKIRNEAGAGNDIFDQATVAALDLSVALGKDLNSSALMIGKALNDPVAGLTALGRAGVQFTEKQKDQIKAMIKAGDVMGAQKLILAELTSQVGGSAKAFGETLPGQLGKAQNQFDEVAATLMTAMLPALTKILGLVTRFSAWAKENPGLMKAIAVALGILATALVAASVAQTLLNLAVLANPFVAAAVAIVAIGVALVVAYKKSERFREVVQKVVGFIREHWFKLLFAFGLLIPIIVKIIQHWGTIRAAGVRAFNAIRPAVQGVRDAVQTLISKVQTLVGWIRDKFGALKEKISALAGPFNKVKTAVSTVVGWLQTMWGWLKSIFDKVWTLNINVPDPTPGFDVPGVPVIASGGRITQTGLAMVHRGEDIIPRARVNHGVRGRAGGRGGGTVNVLVMGGDRQAIDYLRRLLQDDGRRNGRGLLA